MEYGVDKYGMEVSVDGMIIQGLKYLDDILGFEIYWMLHYVYISVIYCPGGFHSRHGTSETHEASRVGSLTVTS